MATDLRFPPMRVSPSASSPPASRRSQQPASDRPATHLPEGGEQPLLIRPCSLCSSVVIISPSLVTSATHPIWIKKSAFSKAPRRTPTSAAHQWGLWPRDCRCSVSPLLHLHLTSCIGSAFVFSNHTRGALEPWPDLGAWLGRGWSVPAGCLGPAWSGSAPALPELWHALCPQLPSLSPSSMV